MSEPLAEGDAWDALWEATDIICCCPSCNFYAPDYEQHKAEPCILTTLIERIAEARAVEAVRQELHRAANDWTQGEWSNVMLPKPPPPAVPVIAYSNRVGDWLRQRAELTTPSGQGVSSDD